MARNINTTEERSFRDAIANPSALDNAISWIGANLNPEDIFSDEDLNDWALKHGFEMDK